MHVTLFEAVQANEVYWPETQAPQAVHVAELVVVENVLPETQAVQKAGDVVLHAVTKLVPAAHTLHVMGAVAPAGQ